MATNNILEIKELSCSYDGKKDVIKNCNLKIEKGIICAIVGESGSGKSTLLRLISGLERPNKGTIKINDNIVSSDSQITPAQERNIGLVFQDFALFPHLTVKENIAFGLKNQKHKITQELLNLIKMEKFADRYPSEISGGQEQRVSIARTLALSPELLLLDEPFSNLDQDLKKELRQEIKNIVKSINTTMIFITHDIIDALDIADEIIFLNDGQLIKHAKKDEIFKNLDNDFIKKSKSDLNYNSELILRAIK